ncbi:MAG: LPS biosynthesis protein WbpP [Chlamydiae bacterium]|nr:MAG: LPS biosynthesis protein WbpP [Chlamydiota bacterium]
MANFLITGGAGFIGSHIVEELVAKDQTVRVIDNLSTGNIDNIKPFMNSIEFINDDIRNANVVNTAMRGIDFVLHQAALPSVPRSIADPITSNEVNINGTLNILWSAHKNKIKRVVMASSSSVYGNINVSPKHEELKLSPESPYAVTKLTGELYARSFYNVYGLETVCLRYFNVFGPRQDPDSPYAAVIPIFVSEMNEGRPAPINGDGSQTRDFTFVKNVVRANLLACEADSNVAGKAMNAACGGSISLLKLVELINKTLGTDIKPFFRDNRAGDVMHSKADISLAKKLMDYEPIIKFEEGLKQTINFLTGN